MKTLIFLFSINALIYGAYLGIGDILPSRMAGNQCKEICSCDSGPCSVDGVPTGASCNAGTRRSNCCDFCGY